MQGSVHSGSARWDDCGQMFPDKLRVRLFPGRFPHYAQSAHSDFVGSSKGVCMHVTCHLHFWKNDRDLLHATAVTHWCNGHRTRVSTQSWPWRRKSSCRSCRDSNSQPFDHESGTLTSKLSWLPIIIIIHIPRAAAQTKLETSALCTIHLLYLSNQHSGTNL